MNRIAVLFGVMLLCGVGWAQRRSNTAETYTKREVMIQMRDGVKLFASIYVPKDGKEKHPILLERTPYGCAPYGPDMRPLPRRYAERNYIMVYSDVRGRFKSEGIFDDLRPQIIRPSGPADIDESTDTYDTIDWLVKNVENNNGRVGMTGISYPGGYAALGAMSKHPALKAVSPQAPTTDWFKGDDVHHNGAFFLQDNFSFYLWFWPREVPRPSTVDQAGRDIAGDSYRFFLNAGPISNLDQKYFQGANVYWNDYVAHPNYDEYWQSRSVQYHLKDIKAASLYVGGLFDAEDLFGPLACFQQTNLLSPKTFNSLCMGPWSHGAWSRPQWNEFHDQVWNQNTSDWYQKEVELPFFDAYLRGNGKPKLAKATMFDTGAKKWSKFDKWPPKNGVEHSAYLGADGTVRLDAAVDAGPRSYTADPANPTPYAAGKFAGRPSTYMLQDQRFLSDRNDVLTYTSQPFTQNTTIAGPITADLYVRTTGTDGDFIVKVIDKYSDNEGTEKFNGYQMLVRAEVMRAKYRNSLSNPQPMTPNAIERVSFDLPDVFHTFVKGHSLEVQIQSYWFPLVDRNPNKFVNIYTAKAEDFSPATVTVESGGVSASRLLFKTIN